MANVNIGVDFGGTGLRVAYSPPGEAARLVAMTGAERPWLLCEPGSDGVLPVSFPSLKSKLGIAPTVEADGSRVVPGDVLAQALDAVRGRIVAETTASIGQTVISVPARYFSTQRTALLEAAGKAGLHEASLITDSVAAVVAQTAGAGTGTFLVYGMGYEGFELGLVRAVRGRYRVLGYEGAAAPGGSTYDAQVLRGWLTVLRQHGVLPDEVRRGDAGWRRLRVTAEKVKERLAAGGPVVVPMFASSPDAEQQLTVQFDRPPFDRLVRSLTAGTLDRVTALFEQAELDRSAVDTVLLVGGSTMMPDLRELVAELGNEVSRAEEGHLARGALLHAHQLGRRSSPAYEEPPATTDTRPVEVVRTPPLAATLLTAPGNTLTAEPAGLSTIDRARQLVRAGQVAEATAELRRVIAEAQGLLDEIAAGQPSPEVPDDEPARESPGAPSAAELLAAARARFARGKPGEAISLAHRAWKEDPNSPDVFQEMLDLHCEAAMATPTVRNFTRDEKWLRCALAHDPSNARIRGLLAERIYLHGKELHRSGKNDEARRVLQHALTWDPEHKPAEDLLRQFAGRR